LYGNHKVMSGRHRRLNIIHSTVNAKRAHLARDEESSTEREAHRSRVSRTKPGN
jgi:hypothetical protein